MATSSGQTKADHPHPPPFGERLISELIVPITAEDFHERSIDAALGLADRWTLPLRLVHVRAPDRASKATDVDAAVDRLVAAHPERRVSGVEVDGDDVTLGVLGVASPSSLIVMATDSIDQNPLVPSAGGDLIRAMDDMAVLCGPQWNPGDGRSVVVALDGSARAEASIEPAAALAHAAGETLWLVTVVGSATVEHTASLRARGENVSESAYIRTKADAIAATGVQVGWEVLYSDSPADAITAFADDRSSALIVVATHGSSGLRQRLVGSVAMAVVEMATVPVLVTKTHVEEPLAIGNG